MIVRVCVMKSALLTGSFFLCCLVHSPALSAQEGDAPRPARASAAQEQLRRSAQEAWARGDLEEHADLLQGYVQLGALRDGVLMQVRLWASQEQCPRASQALEGLPAKYNEALSGEQLQALEAEARELHLLRCGGEANAAQLYALGQKKFKERRWADAATAFGRALELDPAPELAYNAGRSAEYQGDLELALSYYRRALDLAPPPELEQKLRDVLERLGNIQRRRQGSADQAQATGLLDLSTEPPGALARVQGELIGETPLQSAWPAGAVEIQLEKEGFQTWRRTIQLEPGREFVLQTDLAPDSRVWTWVTLGGAGALTAGGVVLGLVSQDKLEEARGVEAARDPALLKDLKEEGRLYSGLSIGSYVVGGLLLGTSAALYFLEAPEAPTQGQASWGLWWDQGWSAGVRGSW